MTAGSNPENNSTGVQRLERVNPSDRAQPVISVIIPTYNRAQMVGRAIRSVLRQTYAQFELIVVDDGSTDETEAVVQSFEDERVRYVYQDNSGATVARNRGVEEANGSYVTFLDSDDEAYESWLEKMIQGFTEHSADIVSCGAAKYLVNDEEPYQLNLPQHYGPLFYNIEGRFTNGGTYALAKEHFDSVGGFHEPLQSGQHTELAIRLGELAAKKGLITYTMDDILIKVNVHQGERVRNNYSGRVAGAKEFLSLHGDRARQLSPTTYATSCSVGCVNALRIRDRKSALEFAVRALKVQPAHVIHWIRVVRCILPFWINDLWDAYSRKRHNHIA